MATGKLILNKVVDAVIGENIIPVELMGAINSDGHYVLLLGNDAIRYNPFKLALRR